jgi:hypothetical protein
MFMLLTRWTGDSSTKDDMIIMENLIPRGFVVLQHGDPKEQNKELEHIFITIGEHIIIGPLAK